MNRHNIKGYQVEVSGKLKQILARITSDEFLYMEGLEEELLGNMQKKLGRTQQEIRSLNEKVL
jgi:uncharacterized protein YjbJ (UPF0337 family)